MVTRAVVFDLDGVLLDSEQLWDEVRREVVAEHGGEWRPEATAAMQGMSSPEWSAYMAGHLGLRLEPSRVAELVVTRLRERYRAGLPLLPGARQAVDRLAARWPLALASSSNRVVIDDVLSTAGLADRFRATVSSEEVARGKPAPDVYLEAVRRLGEDPMSCVAVEDSGNGIRSAVRAGLRVVVVPNPHFPPAADLLAEADAVIGCLDELTAPLLEGLGPHAPVA